MVLYHDTTTGTDTVHELLALGNKPFRKHTVLLEALLLYYTRLPARAGVHADNRTVESVYEEAQKDVSAGLNNIRRYLYFNPGTFHRPVFRISRP